MKKLIIITLGILCVVSISLLWIYKPDTKDEEINKPKKAIDIQKSNSFVKYSLKDDGSFFSIVNNQDVLYSLISINEDLPAKDVFSIDKSSRLKNSIYTTKHGEDGQIISLGGNEDYLVWLDQNIPDYLCTIIVYDISQKKIIATIDGSEKKYFDSFLLNEDTIYWIESDTTKQQTEVGTGEDKDTMIVGNYTGKIKSYHIGIGKQQTIDTIKTVNYPNNELTASKGKLWYIDNRDFTENALIKAYDFDTERIATYDLKEQFLGHLKPIDNSNVAFFKYTIHAAPVGMYLYNTSSRKVTVVNAQETDNRAAYDRAGRIISSNMSYDIDKEGNIKFSDTLQREFNDHFYFSSVGPISSISFTTSSKGSTHFNSVVEFNRYALKWKDQLVP
ncbi:hypothetical protein [Listeria booriae]|uniref:DUF5050 domain-containing protein n=1 Tax=Listeria booriae TaxID=1552123 RepID=A0A7X0XAW9_9LIST|nr:hypothetical protein [Listeria booriae]MBC1490836.1 hypothetical protein [Listeria booriae]MBC1513174.1 hypothetical protein [Listeria booriae]MBC6152015.1 hypothetical protein [Listeria booriae]MBC6306234.1 hypothetical protein [Listeria booriae]